MGYMTNQSMMP